MSRLPIPEGMTMGDILADNARGAAAAREDAAFCAKSDSYFRTTHPGLRAGRNFMWDVMRHRDGSLGRAASFERNYHQTFKGCPGSPDWLASQFCPKCDKRRSMCKCEG